MKTRKLGNLGVSSIDTGAYYEGRARQAGL